MYTHSQYQVWEMSVKRSKTFGYVKKGLDNILQKTLKRTNVMKNFTTYLSTAPVVALIWFTFTAGLIIEINRFFPDPLVFSF